MKTSIKVIVVALLLGAFFILNANAQGSGSVKNIVLVHEAFVDGSGWKPVYEILVKAAGFLLNKY